MSGVGRGEVQEEGATCLHIADSPHCTAESNTTLQSNYTAIKKVLNGEQVPRTF